jgi:hypothetical protein
MWKKWKQQTTFFFTVTLPIFYLVEGPFWSPSQSFLYFLLPLFSTWLKVDDLLRSCVVDMEILKFCAL